MAWQYDSIVEKAINPAGKTVVRVKLVNGHEERTEFFTFHSDPTNQHLRNVVTEFISAMNYKPIVWREDLGHALIWLDRAADSARRDERPNLADSIEAKAQEIRNALK